jgi:hypothetical protein
MAWPCVPDSALNTDSREWLADEKLNWGCKQERKGSSVQGQHAVQAFLTCNGCNNCIGQGSPIMSSSAACYSAR